MNDCVGQCVGKGGNAECICGGTGHATDAAKYLQKRLMRAELALDFYADPETYFACAFLFDPPCGGFQKDFDDTGYLGVKPGKLARETLCTQMPSDWEPPDPDSESKEPDSKPLATNLEKQ
jgi:hypothetical protein